MSHKSIGEDSQLEKKDVYYVLVVCALGTCSWYDRGKCSWFALVMIFGAVLQVDHIDGAGARSDVVQPDVRARAENRVEPYRFAKPIFDGSALSSCASTKR